MSRLMGFCLASLLALYGCDSDVGDDDIIIDGAADVFGPSLTSVPDPGESYYLWDVTNKWDDTNSPTGETWIDYYSTWMSQVTAESDGRVHYGLPDGTTVPAPQLECADTAMFVRFFFAKIHNLPMIIRAGNVFYGHFGAVSRSGSPASIDHYTYDASQEYPPGASTTDDYFDEVMGEDISKMLRMMLTLAGSVTLADDRVTHYIAAESIRPGDLQVHRYGNDGIGHAITVQNVIPSSEEGKFAEIYLMDSVMPSYPDIYNGYTELTEYEECLTVEGDILEKYPDYDEMDCVSYALRNGKEAIEAYYYHSEYGGGLRRWLIPVLTGNSWELRVSSGQVNSSVAREAPGRFIDLIPMTPGQKYDAAVSTIEVARDKINDNPNSCNRRNDREKAFENLYNVVYGNDQLLNSLGLAAEATMDDIILAVDLRQRIIEDFIWAQMVYEESWVCHWNPEPGELTWAIYEAAIEHNRSLLEEGGCEALWIFGAHNVSSTDNGFNWLFDLVEYDNEYSNDENGDLSIEENAHDVPLRDDLFTWFCGLYDSIDYRYGY